MMNPATEDPWCEANRHRCEVGYVAGLADHTARSSYLAQVTVHRGTAMAERLRREAWALIQERSG